MDVRSQQPLNALSPIDVTLLGIMMDDSSLQPENAELPISVTEVGIMVPLHPINRVFDVVSIMALQLSRESKIGFPSSTDNEVRFMHPEKTYFPMVFTELGIVTDLKPIQSQKALSFIVITLLGIVITDKLEQPQNIFLPIVITELGIGIEVKLVHP